VLVEAGGGSAVMLDPIEEPLDMFAVAPWAAICALSASLSMPFKTRPSSTRAKPRDSRGSSGLMIDHSESMSS